MEPANNIHHHHQAEQQLVGCLSSPSSSSSSSLPIPSPSPSPSSPNRDGGVSSTTTTTSSRSSNHAWTPSPYPLSLGNAAGVVYHESWNGGILNARQRNHENLLYPNTSSMIQEQAGGLQWISSQLSAHHDHFSRMKEDHFSSTSSPDSLRNFTEMLNVNSDLTTTSYLVTNDQQHAGDDHLMILRNTDKQLPLKSSTNGNHAQFSPSGVADHMYSPSSIFASANNAMPPMSITGTRSGSFSQIYPSINISNLCSTSNRSSTTGQSSSSPSSATNSSNFEMMKLQALDLLLSPSFSQPSHDHIVNVANGVPFGNYIAHLQQSGARLPPCSPGNKMSNLVSNITNSKEITDAAKRRCSSGFMEPKLKATTVQHSQSASKKSKLESSRASFPPFKVRKEKLGDRIAALQQLVAPFGKTDTASVLMEAIGYIKFLQNQVETLSVPYMKSARKKSSRAMHGGSVAEDGEDEEPKQALRSRGLCLVPLSFMSYLIDDPSGGGGIWSTPDFDGGT